jgi:hypothetical protein
MAAELRIPSADKTVRKFRCRTATRWGSQTAEEHLKQVVERRHHVTEDEDLAMAKEAI